MSATMLRPGAGAGRRAAARASHPPSDLAADAFFLTCTDVTTRDHGPGVAQASLRSGLTARGALHQCLDVDRWQSRRSFGSRVLMRAV